jgi:hypothetical protein
MADTGDVLLKFIEENWAQARQSEDQRATITNIIIGIAAFLHAVLSQTGFVLDAIPISLSLFAIGLFGFVASAKLYERHQFHTERARKLRDRLENLFPETRIHEALSEARKEHKEEWGKWSKLKLSRLHLYWVWLFLHLAISALGVIYTVMIVMR